MKFQKDNNLIEEWPDRKVISYEQVENTFDSELYAVKKILECGHWLVATGKFVIDSGYTKCKKCYEESQRVTAKSRLKGY